jgi:hypothetical protein
VIYDGDTFQVPAPLFSPLRFSFKIPDSLNNPTQKSQTFYKNLTISTYSPFYRLSMSTSLQSSTPNSQNEIYRLYDNKTNTMHIPSDSTLLTQSNKITISLLNYDFLKKYLKTKTLQNHDSERAHLTPSLGQTRSYD